MIQWLTWFMPWFLTAQYFGMGLLYTFNKQLGPSLYWYGATLLNVGVMIMAPSSK